MTMRGGRPGPPGGGNPALLNVAIAHHQAGRLKEADAAYRQVLAAMPKHFDAMHLLGVVALQTGRLDDAHALISGAIALNPKFAAAQNNLGNVYLRQGRLDDAQACFERAVKLQPGFGDAHFNLGNQLRRQGRLQDAAAHFRRAAAADGKSAPAHTSLGATLLELGDARGAVRALETAVEVAARRRRGAEQPRHRARRRRRARARARGARPRAEDRSEVHVGPAQPRHGARAPRPARGSPAVPGERARARARIGRGALQPRQRAARQRRSGRGSRALPEGSRARSRTGRGADRPLARPRRSRPRRRGPRARPPAVAGSAQLGGGAASSRASNALERDDTKGATAAFREAIALQPSNAEAHYHLGTVLMRQLRAARRSTAYERALAADPSHVRARWSLVMAQIPPIFARSGDVAPSRANFARMLAELDRWFEPPGKRGRRQGRGLAAAVSTSPTRHSTNRELLATLRRAVCAADGTVAERSTCRRSRRESTGPHPRRHRIGALARALGVERHRQGLGQVPRQRRGSSCSLFNLGDEERRRDRAGAAVGAPAGERTARVAAMGGRHRRHAGSTCSIYPEIGMDPLTVKLASMRLAPRAGRHVGPSGNDRASRRSTTTCRPRRSNRRTPPPTTPSAWSRCRISACATSRWRRWPSRRTSRRSACRSDVPLLLCPGTPFKYSPLHDDGLDRDLPPRGAVPARLLPAEGQRASAGNSNSGSSGAIGEAGLRFADCVTFVPTLDRARFFGLMQRAHLMLDTLGFSGFNTVIQAIECGLPVVSREGEFMRGRLGSGILRRMGMDSLVATTDEAYVELAVDADAGRSAPARATGRIARAPRRAVRRSRAGARARALSRIGRRVHGGVNSAPSKSIASTE